MSIVDGSILASGRFAVGFGIALALVCAFVIVTTHPGIDAPVVAAPAVVRLDPVVVTISAARYAELRASSAVVRADHGGAEG